MKTYKQIASEVSEAVKEVPEQLREIAFKTILEDALLRQTSTKTGAVRAMESQNRQTRKRRVVTGRSGIFTRAPYREDAVREEVKSAFKILSAEESGLEKFNKLELDWQKYLWVLTVASDRKIDALTNNEIAYILVKKLQVTASEKKVNNLRQKVREGFVMPTEVEGLKAWQILKKGKDLVSSGDDRDGR